MKVFLGMLIVSILVIDVVFSAGLTSKMELSVGRDDKLATKLTADDKLSSLKSFIKNSWNIPLDKQVILIVSGSHLKIISDDDVSLSDQGYKGGWIGLDVGVSSKMELTKSKRDSYPSSGSPIVVEAQASVSVEINANATVGQLKENIQNKWFIPIEAQHLTFGASKIPMMDNNRTLASYNVKDLDYFKVSYVVHKFSWLKRLTNWFGL